MSYAVLFRNLVVSMSKKLLVCFLLFLANSADTQRLLEPSKDYNKGRTIGTSVFCGAGWGGSIMALQFVWYKDFDKSEFHLFNDSHEWMQMDKMGHAFSAWSFARASGDLYEWSGIDHKNSAIIGAGFGFAYLSTFEILDAYNEEWGFSLSDLGANAIGSSLYFGQEYFWNEQRIKMKFSFSNSGLANYRPEVLGNSFSTRLLKDYNGQTYWLSFNPFTVAGKESKIPNWINLALGYGINNHLVGDGSTFVYNNGSTQESFTPYRQYYLSLDVDFEKIPTKSKALKLLFRAINYIKIPFPAVEFSKEGVGFKPFYF